MVSPTATAELAGAFLAATGYGIYITLAPQAYIILRRKGYQGFLLKYLHVTFISMLLANTLHISLSIARVMQAFTAHSDQPLYADMRLSRYDQPLNVIRLASGLSVLMLADGLIVLRTYIIWDKNRKVIILPVLLLITDILHSVQMIIVLATNIEALLGPAIIIFSALSWAMNLSCSALIGYKLWKASKLLDQFFSTASKRLNHALNLIIESAAAYCLLVLGVMISSILDSAALFVFLTIVPSIVGITFLYVIISSSNFKSADVVIHQSSVASFSLGPIELNPLQNAFDTHTESGAPSPAPHGLTTSPVLRITLADAEKESEDLEK